MHLRLPVFLVFLPVLWAQSTTVLDNPTVRVVDALQRPHQKTALHKHDFNRVMVYLTAGDLDVTGEDGSVEHQHWKAGDVAWSPAGGLLASENVGTEDLRMIEIELRRAAPESAPKRDPGLDPLGIDPRHNKLLFENAQVRVFRSTLDVNGREKWHEHVGAGRVAVLLTPLAERVEYPKRESAPANGGPGDILWSAGTVLHRATNLGHRAAEVVVVEVK